jgi:glucose/mannose transport system substrate-binding protein
MTREALLFASLVLGGIGCGSDAESNAHEEEVDAGAEQTLELFSWWVAPGEAEALQSLVDLYKSKQPGARVLNAAIDSGEDAQTVLESRVKDGMPPDLFQENAYDVRTWLSKYPGKLEPLDQLFDDLHLRTAVLPDVIDDVTFEGKIYAMPVNIHRENGMFYNKEIFAAHQLEAPTTMQELLSVCEALKQAGVTPIVTSHEGWIQRIMFESIGSGAMGAQAFHDYMTGKLDPSDPAFLAALDQHAAILDQYVNEDAADEDFGWTQAAQALHDGKAAMFFHGDWAKGYFMQLGWTPGVDFGVVGAPGASDLFVYGVDTFVLPVGAPDPEAARAFLTTVASVEGQVAFNTRKGSSPVRTDVPKNELDPVAQVTASDLEHARIRMLARFRSEWDAAFGDYFSNRDIAALRKAFVDAPAAQ